MRITDLLSEKSIALSFSAQNQAQVIDKMVDLQCTHGNITDRAAYKAALYEREKEASTYVDNGITVPHAKAACVTVPSLAALRLAEPIQYNEDDYGKSDLFFMIAAPQHGNLHVDMLARMMQMLMNDDFVEALRAAKTPKEFLAKIDAQEDAQFGDESFTEEKAGYRILAVTACPTGIAHRTARTGTGTHDGGLPIGAALAGAWLPARLRSQPSRRWSAGAASSRYGSGASSSDGGNRPRPSAR